MSLIKIKNHYELLAYLYDRYAVFSHTEMIKLLDPKIHSYMLKVLERFKKSVIQVSDTNNYQARSIEFGIKSRQRRLIIYGHLKYREIVEDIIPATFIDFIDIVTKLDPKLHRKAALYKKLLTLLNPRVAMIPYQATWISPAISASFPLMDKLGLLIKKK